MAPSRSRTLPSPSDPAAQGLGWHLPGYQQVKTTPLPSKEVCPKIAEAAIPNGMRMHRAAVDADLLPQLRELAQRLIAELRAGGMSDDAIERMLLARQARRTQLQ